MRILMVLGAVFCVTLAIVVGSRMSVDATALVVGVACGVLASIPTSLLLIWAMSRRDAAAAGNQHGGNGSYMYPPVVVVNPGSGSGRPAWGQPGLPGYEELPLPAGVRQYKIVGEPETRVPSESGYTMGRGREW
jgi:hypothetical protein